MTFTRLFFFGALALAASCGATRTTRSQNCSNLRAVVDPSVSPGNATLIESYDPSAALLLFKAASERITIESRCNGRLVNKTTAKHRLTNGQAVDASAPINFQQLEIQLESGRENFEILSSAHCFFRVWDSRISNQVKNNPAIGNEPVRSLLQDMRTRYQLYRSMLTLPQKIITFLPDGTPVSFDYKLPVAPLYEQFFTELDKANTPRLEEVVGREFSKTSLLLDELISDSCKTSEKMLTQLGDSFFETVGNVSNPAEVLSMVNNSGDKQQAIMNALRSRFISGGRNKMCFSQTDMLATPVVFLGGLSPQQDKMLKEIENAQRARIENYISFLRGANSGTYISELTSAKNPASLPAGISSCAWSSKYPGFATTDTFLQLMEKSESMKWTFSQSQISAGVVQLKSVFPNLSLANDPNGHVVSGVANEVLQNVKCGFSGKHYDPSTMRCEAKSSNGRCPPIANADLPTPEEENIAKTEHTHLEKSFRLAATAPVHLHKRMRESSALALTMPISLLNDYLSSGCKAGSDPDCGEVNSIKLVLSNLAGKYLATLDAAPQGQADYRQTLDVVAANDLLQFSAIDQDNQFFCRFKKRGSGTYSDNTAALFNNLSLEARSILNSDPGGMGGRTYFSMGSRFLFLKCIPLGIQRLYNDLKTYSGLLHAISFANVGFVKSDAGFGANATSLGNKEILESGRPIALPFVELFLGEAARNLSPPEKAARLFGGPHLELPSCSASGARGNRICGDLTNENTTMMNSNPEMVNDDLPLVHAHLTFTSALPNWLPESEKQKRGDISFPQGSFSEVSSRYFFSEGDSGTTVTMFGLFPIFMLSTVQDRPVSGGLAVIPTSGGQKVQPAKDTSCR